MRELGYIYTSILTSHHLQAAPGCRMQVGHKCLDSVGPNIRSLVRMQVLVVGSQAGLPGNVRRSEGILVEQPPCLCQE